MKLAAVLARKFDTGRPELIGEIDYEGMQLFLVLDRRRSRSRPDPREGELWAFHPGRLIWASPDGTAAWWSVYPAHRIKPQSRGIATRRVVRGMVHASQKEARHKAVIHAKRMRYAAV